MMAGKESKGSLRIRERRGRQHVLEKDQKLLRERERERESEDRARESERAKEREKEAKTNRKREREREREEREREGGGRRKGELWKERVWKHTGPILMGLCRFWEEKLAYPNPAVRNQFHVFNTRG